MLKKKRVEHIEELILGSWQFYKCFIDDKETILYDKTEKGIVTTDYSLIKFNNDYTGEFKYEGKTHEFIWGVMDGYNIRVKFNDDSFGIVTFKDDDIIVFNYNNMFFVYEYRV